MEYSSKDERRAAFDSLDLEEGCKLKLDWWCSDYLKVIDVTQPQDPRYFFVDPKYYHDAPQNADKYQCLALKNPSLWVNYIKQYHCFSSYESDQEYLQFFPLLAKEVKESDDLWSTEEKARVLASKFPNMSEKLIPIGARDVSALLYSFELYDRHAKKLFELWEMVVKDKVELGASLNAVYGESMQESLAKEEWGALLDRTFQINEKTSDDHALRLIKEFVYEDSEPSRYLYYDFIPKKEAIAREIGIISDENDGIRRDSHDNSIAATATDGMKMLAVGVERALKVQGDSSRLGMYLQQTNQNCDS